MHGKATTGKALDITNTQSHRHRHMSTISIASKRNCIAYEKSAGIWISKPSSAKPQCSPNIPVHHAQHQLWCMSEFMSMMSGGAFTE
eukprot:1159736-Pelagomonas_calceolata.AAC.10